MKGSPRPHARSGGAGKQISDPCLTNSPTHRMCRSRRPSVVIAVVPVPRKIGGSTRGCTALADHALRAAAGQMRLQCLAGRQALADGDPLRVMAGRGLEAQPRSAGSRRRLPGLASRAAAVQPRS